MISASSLAQTPSPAPAAPPAATTPDTTATTPPPPTKASKKKAKKAKAAAAAAEAAPPSPPEAPTASSATKQGGSAVFPTAVAAKYASQKPGDARMHTCLDQYHANKAANGNGGLKWIQKGGGYYSECTKKLKTAPAS
jgi:hypothetical protein